GRELVQGPRRLQLGEEQLQGQERLRGPGLHDDDPGRVRCRQGEGQGEEVISARAQAPFLGVGVGLRPRHFARVLEAPDSARLGIDFFEAISENYMLPGGRPLRVLEQVRERFPVVFHGVSLNIGSADPLDPDYLAELAALAQRYQPAWLSDHLCWTGVRGRN